MLLDPNTLSKDGTVALAGTAVSDDGKYLAYGVAEAGSDWNTWKVRSVDTGKDLPDDLHWVKFSGASWTKDGKGFFYSRYDEPEPGAELKDVNLDQKIYYHKLGTPQAEDVLVYERQDQPEWGLHGAVTDDGRYLVIGVAQGKTENTGLFYKDLATPGAPVVELLAKFDAQYGFVGNDGPVFWVQADMDAPRGRVIAIDTRKPEPKDWEEVIPEAKDALQGVGVVGDRFVAAYLQDARSVVRTFDLDGKPLRRGRAARHRHAPAASAASARTPRRSTPSPASPRPPRSTATTWPTGKSSVFRAPKVDFDPADYETRQVFYTSKDGTRVPDVHHPQEGAASSTARTRRSSTATAASTSRSRPASRSSNLAWLEMGGVYAVANLRGGGEYGDELAPGGHEARQKQNVFDDFIAAAEWLIANKDTTHAAKLAIEGGSNGGLLVGACLTQRPELFGAAVPAVGVMDMLRFHKFTIGWAWVSDYGSSDDAEEFEALRAYSPLPQPEDGHAAIRRRS